MSFLHMKLAVAALFLSGVSAWLALLDFPKVVPGLVATAICSFGLCLICALTGVGVYVVRKGQPF